jgi:hypothetical protein
VALAPPLGPPLLANRPTEKEELVLKWVQIACRDAAVPPHLGQEGQWLLRLLSALRCSCRGWAGLQLFQRRRSGSSRTRSRRQCVMQLTRLAIMYAADLLGDYVAV